MKLRLSKQQLRFRLNEADLHQLRHVGLISSSTFFGPVQAQFGIMVMPHTHDVALNYDQGYFHVTMARERMIAWIDDPTVISLRRRIQYDDYPDVLLLLEKDLGCKHEEAVPGEDAANLYPTAPPAGEAASDT